MLKTSNRPVREFESVDEISFAAFRAFRDAMRANAHAMAKRLAAKGAHMGQAACLQVLSGNDGITQRDMAKMLHISRPSITGILQAVEKSGAIVRRPDEADQRLTRVYLTDKGRAMATELRRVLADYIMETIGQMPERHRRDLTRLLNELNSRITSTMMTEREDCTK